MRLCKLGKIKCPKCAGSVTTEDAFCQHCGYSLKPIKPEIILSHEDDDEEFEEDFLIVELTDDEEEKT